MAVSTETLLSETEDAISLILRTAQSYDVAGRRKVMAELSQLMQLRQTLKDEAASSANSGSMISLLQMEQAT